MENRSEDVVQRDLIESYDSREPHTLLIGRPNDAEESDSARIVDLQIEEAKGLNTQTVFEEAKEQVVNYGSSSSDREEGESYSRSRLNTELRQSVIPSHDISRGNHNDREELKSLAASECQDSQSDRVVILGNNEQEEESEPARLINFGVSGASSFITNRIKRLEVVAPEYRHQRSPNILGSSLDSPNQSQNGNDNLSPVFKDED